MGWVEVGIQSEKYKKCGLRNAVGGSEVIWWSIGLVASFTGSVMNWVGFPGCSRNGAGVNLFVVVSPYFPFLRCLKGRWAKAACWMAWEETKS